MIVLSTKPATTRGERNDDVEREYDDIDANTSKTAEDVCIMHDDLRKALAALQEYVSTHANPIRNVLF